MLEFAETARQRVVAIAAHLRDRIAGTGLQQRRELLFLHRDELRLRCDRAPHIGEHAMHQRATVARIEAGAWSLERLRVKAHVGERTERARRLVAENSRAAARQDLVGQRRSR